MQAGGNGGALPAWLIALIVMCSCAAFIMLLAVLGAIVRVLNPDGSGGGLSCAVGVRPRVWRCTRCWLAEEKVALDAG